MVPFLGFDHYDPVEMNELAGWSDDLHLNLASLISWPIREGLGALSDDMQAQGLIQRFGDPLGMNLDELAQLVRNLADARHIELAGELQKLIFKVQVYESFRLFDGRDQLEMDYWTSDIDAASVSPLFLAGQSALDRIDYMTAQEALEAEAEFSANQLESIDVLASLPEAAAEEWSEWSEYEYGLQAAGRAVGAPPERRLRQRRRGVFPKLVDITSSMKMDDMYEALVAHANGQLRQLEEREQRPGFTKQTFNALLVGDRGIGKSTIIASIFSSLGLRYAIFNAATMDPYLDLVGLPYVDKFGDEDVSRTALPLTLAQGVDAIFIDELNRASMPVQNALMQIILEGKVNDHPIPGLKLVWAAINPPQTGSKNYGVQNLNWALEGRFTIYQLPHDVSEKYFLGREDFREAFGEKTIREVIEWWRKFQDDKNVAPDEKAYLDPRTLDNIMTQVAGAKRRGEHVLINAVAKSLSRYETVLEELGRLLSDAPSTQDALLDVMMALNEAPNNTELILELKSLLTNDPEGSQTALNDMMRYLYASKVEEVENVVPEILIESTYFDPQEIQNILLQFFALPNNTFFQIWLEQQSNPAFQDVVNIFFTMLSQYEIPLEARGPQLLTNIRGMWRIEALLINSALGFVSEEGQVSGRKGKGKTTSGPEGPKSLRQQGILDLILQVFDPSIFPTEFPAEKMGDNLDTIVAALPPMPIQEEFAQPVLMVKRNLILALIDLYNGAKLKPIPAVQYETNPEA